MIKYLSISFILLLSLNTFAAKSINSAQDMWDGLPDLSYEKASMMLNTFKSDSMTRTVDEEEELIKELLEANLSKRFSKVRVNIDENGSFKVTMKYRFFWFMKVKIRLAGTREYDYENFTMNLELKKARAFIFSIRGKIFDYLEQMNDPSMTINRPFIIIDLF
jgi:hypothetical protein